MNKYCYFCDKEVEPKIEENFEEFEVRGKKYKYTSIKSICPICFKELEVLDQDIERRERAYREEEGLIQNDEIESIISKYKIGKKPLAKLLGWSEVTIIRYLNGETPNKMYSDELYRILKSPEYMEELLLNNKNNITQRAFDSAMKAINTKDNESEISLIASYITEKVDVTPIALQKLLYYCQGFFTAFYGKRMFKEDCKAWIYGPVYTMIYQKYKKYSYEKIFEKSVYSVEEIIDDEKKKVIDSVINSFGIFSSSTLAKMTHEEKPWIEARKGLKDEEISNKVIKISDIKKYFESVIVDYDISEIDDISKYSKKLFAKLYN